MKKLIFIALIITGAFTINASNYHLQLLGSSVVTYAIDEDIMLWHDPGVLAISDHDTIKVTDIHSDIYKYTFPPIGDYIIRYHFDEGNGIIDSIQRIIRISDLNAPLIFVLGDNPIVFNLLQTTHEQILKEIDVRSIKVNDNHDPVSLLIISDNANKLPLDKPGVYEVRYTAIDLSGNMTTANRIVEITTNTSVKNIDNYKLLQIYPNPAIDKIHIETPLIGGIFSIYDLNGACIKTWENDGKEIDISAFAQGCYLITFTHSGNSYHQLFQVNVDLRK